MQRAFLYDDVKITYSKEGEGIAVILLHGFGEDADVWKEQASFLKPYCMLIIPDLPGSGLSEFIKEKAGNNYSTIEYYAECIKALIDFENISACIMLGHSMGGYITLAFAEKYPALLKSFGLIHSTAFADNEEKKESRRKGIELIEAYGAYAFLKNTIPNLFSVKFKKEHPDKIEALIERGKSFSKRSLRQYYTAMMERPDRTDVLRNSEVPVLFVIGTEDVAAPAKDVLQQTHLPKIAYIHVLENTGHMGMWEDAEKVNDAILNFIIDTIERK